MNRQSASAIEIFVPIGEDEPVRFDEPNFTGDYLGLYRELVRKMEAEALQIPGVKTAIGLIIRNLARDYVVRVIADRTGDRPTMDRERDRRMIASFKLLLDQAAKADLAEAIRTQYVLGLVNEAVRVIFGLEEDEEKALQMAKTMRAAFGSYVTRENKKMSGGR